MSDEETLAKLKTMTPEVRAKLMAMIHDGTRTVLDLEFKPYADSWLCDSCEHDILITRYDGHYTVHVHERNEVASVIAGPFTTRTFEFCVAWVKGRCGKLPDQMAKLLERAGKPMSCFACKAVCHWDARGCEAECTECGYINVNA